jgi:transposase
VCIGLVVTPEGLPVAHEVFAGNRADVTRMETMVRLLEEKYGPAQRVWVLDREMVSEASLAWWRERGALDWVGTPKSQLRQFEKALLDEADGHTVRYGLEVKWVAAPDGTSARRLLKELEERHSLDVV